MKTKTDKLFAHYQETRDPESLAAVFDAIAEKLLLVAMRLCRDRAEAEDLIQATFLRMMEKAEQYQANRPLIPWVNQILTNEARMRWRRQTTRREQDREELRQPPRPEPSAEDVVASAEAAEIVTKALDALPQVYRSVLRLRLLRGLRTTEIGQTLDIPEATVRTRLARGLNKLRAGLPAGIVSTFVLLLNDVGLGQVRARVLAHAEAIQTQSLLNTGAKTTLTVAAKSQVLIIATVVAILGIIVYQLEKDDSDALDGRESALANQSPILPRRQEGDGNKAKPQAQAPLSNQDLLKPSQVTGNSWTVQGRILDEYKTGIPAAQVRIEMFRGRGIEKVAHVSSAADGRYFCDLSLLRDLPLAARAIAGIRVVAQKPGYKIDAGEYLMSIPLDLEAKLTLQIDRDLVKGAYIEGIIADDDGKPVDEGVVTLTGIDSKVLATSYLESAGRFQFDWPEDYAGEWATIRAASVSYGTAQKRIQRPQSGGNPETHRLLLHPGKVMRQRFLMSDSGPAIGLRVWLSALDGGAAFAANHPMHHLKRVMTASDMNGGISIASLNPGRYRLEVEQADGGKQTFELDRDAPKTTHQLEGQLFELILESEKGLALAGIEMRLQRQDRGAKSAERIFESIGPSGHLWFLLPESSAWSIKASVAGVFPLSQNWQVLAGVARARHVAKFSDSLAAPGFLEIALRNEAKQKVESFMVDLYAPGADRFQVSPLLSFDSADLSQAETQKLSLPPGRYQLFIGPKTIQGAKVNGTWFELERQITIRSHETACLEAEVETGGVIALSSAAYPQAKLLLAEDLVQVNGTQKSYHLSFHYRAKGDGFEIGQDRKLGLALYHPWPVKPGPHHFRFTTTAGVFEKRVLVEAGRTLQLVIP